MRIFRTTRGWLVMGAFLLALIVMGIPHGCDLLWGNAPMNLYGKTVDQMGQPARGAVLSFNAMAFSRFQAPVLFAPGGETRWRVQATSDDEGRFEIQGGWGRMLSLESVSGPGYSQCLPSAIFNYGRRKGVETYVPDPAHPATILCWNNAYKHIISRTIMAHIGSDVNAVSYRLERISPDGTNDDDFYFRITRPTSVTSKPYDWSVELDHVRPQTVEILGCDGPLQPRAPENSYVRELTLMMRSSDRKWSNEMTKRFYTRSNHGTVYAGVEMTVKLGDNGEDSIVTIHYTADFGNSRDLVPGPVVPVDK